MLSPVNQLNTPLRFGAASYISPRALPASTAVLIAVESAPVTTVENSFRDAPNGTNCAPSFDRLLSPVNQLNTPLRLGIESYISPRALPAVTAAVIDSAFTPTTTEEKSFIA